MGMGMGRSFDFGFSFFFFLTCPFHVILLFFFISFFVSSCFSHHTSRLAECLLSQVEAMDGLGY